MAKKIDMVIDMSPDGRIIAPASPSFGTIVARVVAFGMFLLILGIAFWTALFILPVLLVLGIVAFFALRAKLRGNGGRVVFTRRF